MMYLFVKLNFEFIWRKSEILSNKFYLIIRIILIRFDIERNIGLNEFFRNFDDKKK